MRSNVSPLDFFIIEVVKIVHAHHAVACFQQAVNKMRADEAGTTGDEEGGHGLS
jgi:hypothetical protein